jgi:hypothetical protein
MKRRLVQLLSVFYALLSSGFGLFVVAFELFSASQAAFLHSRKKRELLVHVPNHLISCLKSESHICLHHTATKCDWKKSETLYFRIETTVKCNTHTFIFTVTMRQVRFIFIAVIYVEITPVTRATLLPGGHFVWHCLAWAALPLQRRQTLV